MENQHRKITGYRELNQEEIKLMNDIKAHGEGTRELLDRVATLRINDKNGYQEKLLSSEQYVESMRCLGVARDNLQTGQMWFVRAVALPNSF